MGADIYTEECSICVGAIDDATIIEIAGEVDIATVSLLAKALDDAVHSRRGPVILDAQRLTYIDSAGLQTLVSVQQKLESQARRLAIVGCHGIFHKLMKIGRFESRFQMFPTMEDALAELGARAAEASKD